MYYKFHNCFDVPMFAPFQRVTINFLKTIAFIFSMRIKRIKYDYLFRPYMTQMTATET